MSAFVVEDSTINRVANFINRDSSAKWYLRETGLDHLDPAAVAQALFDLNVQAVNARYGEGQAEEFRPLDFKWHPFVVASPIATYKSLTCLMYQCSEGNVPETPLYKALEKMRSSLADQIIRALPGYDEAPWN